MNSTTSFKECSTPGYKTRTILNASADATIAIAVNFNTAGERLTRNSVIHQLRKYIPVDISNGISVISPKRVQLIVDQLQEIPAKHICINIAGNGIYTFKNKYTQVELNEYVFSLLWLITGSPKFKKIIHYIRSGGQTGIDEAGIIAARNLNIKSYILAPKGWVFRDINGIDISDEKQFKQRFL